jgi:hypothetical protein
MDFNNHRMTCKKCQSVNPSETKTLSNCCHEGAPLLRDYLNSLVAPAIRKKQAALKAEFSKEADGKSYRTTRAKLKEVMRFK